MVRLKLFGGTTLEGPDGPVTGRAVQRRRIALLALLAAARGRGVPREKLIAHLWPDSEPDRARPMLSDSVYRINQALGGEALVAVGDDLRLDPERLPCDVIDFARAMAAGRWRDAVEAYAGPFLDGFFLTGADAFERWADTERTHLARERGRALEALVGEAEQAGDAAEAAHWARQLAAHDPFSSRFALRLMQALERAGERAAALQHARVHAVLLKDELGVEPDAAVVELEARLRSARAPAPAAKPASAPVIPEPTSPGTPAPAPPSIPADAVPPRRRPRRLALAAGGFALLVVFALPAMRAVLAPSAPGAMIVVPFSDLSPGRDQDYLADGVTEELIVRLSRVPDLDVVGRTSAFSLKGSAADVREIRERFGVDAVLSGSVRRAGERIRVVAQLVDAKSGYQLWSETYERELADVFAIQDEIARAIVTRLRGELSGADSSRIALAHTDDPEAYNLYLRGRFEWHRRSEQGLRGAARYFREATERAPDYARAHAGLADAYAVLGFYDYLPPAEAFPAAASSARRALALQPDLAAPHATLAYVALYYEWDWARAESEFRRALELDPAYSTGHQWYANFLTAIGRFEEAKREMRVAMELDPLSLIANAALGWTMYHAGEHRAAIDQLTRTLQLNPQFELAYLWRGWAHAALGDHSRQLADLRRAFDLSGGSAISTAALARGLAVAGQAAEARTLLASVEAGGPYVPSYEIARAHVALGDLPTALSWLERALGQRSHSMAFLAVDPQLAPLRGHPGYRRLVRSLALPQPRAPAP